MSFKTLIIKQKAFYRRIIPTFCPILNETVYFTSEGFNHLLYKNHWRPRTPAEKFMKLKCLSYAPKVIKNCSQQVIIRKVRRKINGNWKDCLHFQLVYEVKKGASVRVIIEKIGNGHCKFLSVMPHDNRSKKVLTPTKKHS